jgi:ATP-dependent exoDNAse (exonuclease V) alpha subunit
VLRVKARGQKDLVAVVGHAVAISAGEFVTASARGLQRRPRHRALDRRRRRRARRRLREVAYGFGGLDELVLAYATIVHKSQGSEFPAVVIPLTTQHYAMLRRNLLYTGVTRRRLVVLVGQRLALAIAVRGRQQVRRRWSKLKEWLAEQ